MQHRSHGAGSKVTAVFVVEMGGSLGVRMMAIFAADRRANMLVVVVLVAKPLEPVGSAEVDLEVGAGMVVSPAA